MLACQKAGSHQPDHCSVDAILACASCMELGLVARGYSGRYANKNGVLSAGPKSVKARIGDAPVGTIARRQKIAVRGVLGFGAIGLAVLLGRSTGTAALAASMGLGIAGFLALKGCPICSTTGLIELVWSRTREVSQ